MGTVSRDSVVSAVREAAHEEYAISDKVSGKYCDEGVQRVVNDIVRFFAERIINKIDALEGVDSLPCPEDKCKNYGSEVYCPGCVRDYRKDYFEPKSLNP